MLFLGDSTIEGVGSPSAGDGSGGLLYGGASVPAGVTYTHDGVGAAAWPSNGGAGPEPGILPHVAEDALDPLVGGFTGVRLDRFGTTGQTTNTIQASDFHQAVNYLAGQGVEPDLVVIGAGSNDSQNGENAGFETALDTLLRNIETTWPNARIVLIKPVPLAAGSYPEADLVRADIDARVSAKVTRSSVSHVGVTRADSVHPDIAGYRLQGRAVLPAYLAMG